MLLKYSSENPILGADFESFLTIYGLIGEGKSNHCAVLKLKTSTFCGKD